jgi:hypothetical protein
LEILLTLLEQAVVVIQVRLTLMEQQAMRVQITLAVLEELQHLLLVEAEEVALAGLALALLETQEVVP